jgi:cytochrome c-type biogenesis protein CcmH
MSLFVALAALLALLCLALLTRPLWRRAGSAAPPIDAAAVALLRRQLEQLAAQKKSGTLGAAQYDQARLALERRIVDAVVSTPAPRAPAQAKPKGLMIGLAGFVSAIAVGGYAWLGTPQVLSGEIAVAAAPAAEGHQVTAEQIEAMIAKLEARLKEAPADVDGWVMLGRTHAVLGRHEQAAPAYKQALALRPGDAALMVDYADALAVVNGRSLDGEPSRLVEQALKIEPDNLKALSLAGTAAFNRKDYALALKHWEKMAQLAPSPELQQQIQGGIDEARRLAAGAAAGPAATPAAPAAAAAPAAPVAPTAQAAAATPAGASVSGTVTLAPALAAKAAPTDTVFIFARAAEGPRMPLAILRKQVKDLPLTFTLDDSLAMSPAAKLSSATRVIVGARISKSGEALPRAGDLQGLSAAVAPGASGLKIEIGETIGP